MAMGGREITGTASCVPPGEAGRGEGRERAVASGNGCRLRASARICLARAIIFCNLGRDFV